MNTTLAQGARALPALADRPSPPIALRPPARWWAIAPTVGGLVLLALLLVGAALTLLPVGNRAPAPPAVDVGTLPTPAGFSPVPADASWAPLGVDLTDPARRGWTTGEDPATALDTMVAALKGAGWALEDVPAGGWLPPMPHVARLGRPDAQLFVNAWRQPADPFTRVAAVLVP